MNTEAPARTHQPEAPARTRPPSKRAVMIPRWRFGLVFSYPVSLAFLVLWIWSPLSYAQYQPQDGETHPNFQLMDIESDQPMSLFDFRGKKLLLIHFASW